MRGLYSRRINNCFDLRDLEVPCSILRARALYRGVARAIGATGRTSKFMLAGFGTGMTVKKEVCWEIGPDAPRPGQKSPFSEV